MPDIKAIEPYVITQHLWERLANADAPNYCYKSDDPVMAHQVREWQKQLELFNQKYDQLREAFNSDLSGDFEGLLEQVNGLLLGPDECLDVHWTRPGKEGARRLRAYALIRPGADSATRDQIRKEHSRLQELWALHCPPPISLLDTWSALEMDMDHVIVVRGELFERHGTAYFRFSLPLDTQEHQERWAAKHPLSGSSAVITAIPESEYILAYRYH